MSALNCEGVPSQQPHIEALPVQLAITEVVELFFVLQQVQLKDQKTIPKGHGVKVKIKTADVVEGDMGRCTEEHLWFLVKVRCTGIPFLPVAIKDFLVRCGTFVRRIVEEMEARFIGSFLTCESWSFVDKKKTLIAKLSLEKGATGQIVVNEEKVKDTECQGFLLSIQLLQEKQYMLAECEGIHGYLHKLKLFNPEMQIQFYLKIGDEVTSSKFENHHKCFLGQRKVAADVKHFVNSSHEDQEEELVDRIQLKFGRPIMLLGVALGQAGKENLKVSAAATIVPPPPDDGVVPNQLCKQLKVLFYGPGGLPLLLPGVAQVGLGPITLVKLSEYGLKADCEQTQTHADKKDKTVIMDWCYKLKPTEDCDGEASNPPYSIVLFVILDFFHQPQQPKEILNHLESVDNIRQRFCSILQRYRGKVRKAVAIAFNKLLQNYTKVDQKQELLKKAIPTMVQSLGSIVKMSTNESFRQSCFSNLKVTNSRELRCSVKERLWTMASARYDVSIPEDGDISQEAVELRDLLESQASAHSSRDVSSCNTQQTQTQPTQSTQDDAAGTELTEQALGSLLAQTSQAPSNALEEDTFESLGLELLPGEKCIFEGDFGDIDDIEATEQALEALVQDAVHHKADNIQESGGAPEFEIPEDWFNEILGNC